MATTQLLKRCMNRSTQRIVEIHMVSQTESYRRLLQPGWETVREEHIKRVEEEVQKLPANATTVKIRDIFHQSSQDPREHITLDVEDENGNHMTTKHVTKDPAQQESSSEYSATASTYQQSSSSTSEWVWDEQRQQYKYWDGEKWVWG